MKKCFLAYGQLRSELDFLALHCICSQKGLAASVRESSHYEGGKYLLLSTPTEARLSFEKIASNEFLLSGEAENAVDLLHLCRVTSAALSAAQLAHRVELYNLQDQQYQYYHHRWE